MIDLTTNYLGLKLRCPLVASASPLSKDLDSIRRMEDSGIGAVVLHSLFEEQIELESEELDRRLSDISDSHAESLSYFPDLGQYNIGPEGYLEHIREAKQAVRIPVIASLNGSSLGGWTRYAQLMEQAGADALELNTYYLATDPEVTGAALEQNYVDLVQQVKSQVRIPVSIKIGPYFSSLANLARRLDQAGADALVIFNRFYQPDFDLETLSAVPSLNLSHSDELLLRLHWAAILFGRIKADIAITGGVHTAVDVLKSMMAGARVAMMTSCLLRHGTAYAAQVLRNTVQWLEEHEYESLRQMQGSMSYQSVADTAAFERGNYMKVLSSYALEVR